MSTLMETRIDPLDLSEEQLKELLSVVQGGAKPVLIAANGKPFELPPSTLCWWPWWKR